MRGLYNDPDLPAKCEQPHNSQSSTELCGRNTESEANRVPRESEAELVLRNSMEDRRVVATTVGTLTVEHEGAVNAASNAVRAELNVHTDTSL